MNGEDKPQVAEFLSLVAEKLTPELVAEAMKSNGHFELHFADKKFQRVLLFRTDRIA